MLPSPAACDLRLSIRLALAVVCVAILGASLPAHAAPSDAAPRSRLALVRADPVTVRGSAFHRRERVRVVLVRARRGASITHVTADSRGRFSATFAGIAVSRCARFAITARGRSGSRAAVRRVPLPGCIAA